MNRNTNSAENSKAGRTAAEEFVFKLIRGMVNLEYRSQTDEEGRKKLTKADIIKWRLKLENTMLTEIWVNNGEPDDLGRYIDAAKALEEDRRILLECASIIADPDFEHGDATNAYLETFLKHSKSANESVKVMRSIIRV